MSNSTQFKEGDKAIVLPAKWPVSTSAGDGRGHWLQPFTDCKIVANSGYAFSCIGFDVELGTLLPQDLQPHQLQTLPIPYHELDGE